MEDEKSQAGRIFETFVQASTCKSTLQAFNLLCAYLELDPLEHDSFYSSLKSRLTCWKAKALWSKLDKRASHKEYKKGKTCEGTKVSVLDAERGPVPSVHFELYITGLLNPSTLVCVSED